jgi:hypothetical protein
MTFVIGGLDPRAKTNDGKPDFFANGLCCCCHQTGHALSTCLQFHKEVEDSWKKKYETFEMEVKKKVADHPDREEDIWEDYSWDLHEYQSIFPGMHRKSLLITMLNLMEHDFNELCKIITISTDQKLKLKDINGRGVNRALDYLKKVVEFDLNKVREKWPDLQEIIKLRNKIVHSGGQLDENPNDHLNWYVNDNEFLRGSPGAEVLLEEGFIDQAIENARAFFDELDKQVQVFMQQISTEGNN